MRKIKFQPSSTRESPSGKVQSKPLTVFNSSFHILEIEFSPVGESWNLNVLKCFHA